LSCTQSCARVSSALGLLNPVFLSFYLQKESVWFAFSLPRSLF
jgi:hypothetical protein